MITHAFDIAVINSWLEYRQISLLNQVERKTILDLIDLKTKLAENLISAEQPVKRGRLRCNRHAAKDKDEPQKKKLKF